MPRRSAWCALLIYGCATTGAAPTPHLLELARAQDPAQLETMAAGLGAAAAGERALAAFALGQLGTAWQPVADPVRARAEAQLISALERERDATVRDRMIEALGKLAGTPGLEVLRAELGRQDGARARAGLAIGVRARSSRGK